MEKLVVCVMGQNCEKTIDMCLESVKGADAIVYCDGGSKKELIEHVKGYLKYDDFINVIQNPYDQKDPKMNGKQRNFYLNYLKENYPDHWALCLDADEVVEDLSKIKEFIQTHSPDLYSVKMRHFIGDLGHEDSTVPEHYVLNRLFRIDSAGIYPEVEHPVLQQINGTSMNYKTDCTTIWHLAYIPNLWDIKKRYDNHLAKSQMHTPEYLKGWYYAHLFGSYPKKPFNPVEIPRVILNKFGINKDELYFAGRGLEHKHWLDAVAWTEFFPEIEHNCFYDYILFGCGLGPRVYTLDKVGCNFVKGVEKSQYAVDNRISDEVILGDVLDYDCKENINTAVVTVAYDLLEHLEYKHLNKVINTLIKYSRRYILISVPFKGTPNCDADPTHIIKEDRDWWIKQFTEKKMKLIKTPDTFPFKEQILIFEK